MVLDERRSEMATLARLIVAVIAVLALFSGVVEYYYVTYDTPLKPLYFIALVTAGGFCALALEPHRPMPALKSPVVVWVLAYLILSTAWGLWRPVISSYTTQQLVDRYRSMTLFMALLFAFADPTARRAGQLMMVVAVVFASVVNVAELGGFIKFAEAAHRPLGRAAGFYINPNGAGMAIVRGLAVSALVLPRSLRIPLIVAVACGVAATFSRSAMLCLIVLALIWLWQKEIPAWPALVAVGGVAAFLVYKGTGFIQNFLESGGSLNPETMARLRLQADDSGRGALARRVWHMFLQAPWLGNGMATENQGRISHNVYLSLANEHGVIGFFILPAFAFAIALRRHAALGFAAVLLLSGVMSHGPLESEEMLLCAAIAAGMPLSVKRAAGAADEEASAADALSA